VGNLVVQSKARPHESFVPGQKIHLVALLGRLRRNRVVAFVEDSTDSSLMLLVPESDQAILELAVGSRVELGIGFRIARMHFVCAAVVLSLQGNLVTLSRPSEAKKQPRRAFARVAYRWPVVMTMRDGQERTGTTLNVSASGALIKLDGAAELLGTLDDDKRIVLIGIGGREYGAKFQVIRTVRERDTTMVAIHFEEFPEVERVHLELQVLRGIARRFLRVAVPLSCTLELKLNGENVTLRGSTENVSGGGAAIQCEGHCEVSANLRGRLALQLDDRVLQLADVSVLRILDSSDVGSRIVLEFPDIAYDRRVELVEFLMEKLGASRSCAD